MKYLTFKRAILFMIIGFTVFALYLYFYVGFGNIFLVVSSVNIIGYLSFYMLSISCTVLLILCWVIAWKSLLASVNVKISLKNAFLYYWTGYFIDLIVPCQQICGEVTRVYLVHKKTNENYGVVGAAGVVNRLVGYSIVFAGLTSGVIYLFTTVNVPPFALNLLVLAWVGALLYFSVLLYLTLSDQAADKISAFVFRFMKMLRLRRRNQGFSPEFMDALKRFHGSFLFFRSHPRKLVKPYVFQAAAYSLSLVIYIFVFYSLGLTQETLSFFILVYFLAGAVQDLASAFSVGGLEILLTSIFIFYGIEPAKSGVAAGVLRSVTYWFPLIAGYVIVQIVGARRLLNVKEQERIQAEQEEENKRETELASESEST
jgi:uncharacterized protein (TIRG00374 family)